MLQVINQTTMTSREIAELTGKRHDHVMTDIRKMLVAIDAPEKSGTYKTTQGNEYQELLLDKEQTLILVSGYNIKMRAAIVRRWQELEVQQQPVHKIPQTYAEALRLAAEQAEKLALAAPKVEVFDRIIDRGVLMTATQVGQKISLSAIKLNQMLGELNVYNRNVKRARAFQQWFIDKGFGEMKQTEQGYSQPLFTNAGEMWVVQQLKENGTI